MGLYFRLDMDMLATIVSNSFWDSGIALPIAIASPHTVFFLTFAYISSAAKTLPDFILTVKPRNFFHPQHTSRADLYNALFLWQSQSPASVPSS